MKRELGQTTVFFALILTGLLLLTGVGIEIGRIVYAAGRWEKRQTQLRLQLHQGSMWRHTGRQEKSNSCRMCLALLRAMLL